MDFDDAIEELFRQWEATNALWRDHLQYIFKQYCRMFHVLEEHRYATDQGQVYRDTLLVEVSSAKEECAKHLLVFNLLPPALPWAIHCNASGIQT